MRSPQALIFDMDGVLIDSEPLWRSNFPVVAENPTLTSENYPRSMGLIGGYLDAVVAGEEK